MEASSKVVSFLFVPILSSQSSCALSLDHAVGVHWKWCLRRVKSPVEAVVAVLREC